MSGYQSDHLLATAAPSRNPGPGGWAALLIYGETSRRESAAANRQTTNNQMELTAAIKALEALTRPCEVDFYTDSQYLRQGITEWIKKWRKNGWRTSDKKPVLNQALWMRLYELTQPHTIQMALDTRARGR